MREVKYVTKCRSLRWGDCLIATSFTYIIISNVVPAFSEVAVQPTLCSSHSLSRPAALSTICHVLWQWAALYSRSGYS